MPEPEKPQASDEEKEAIFGEYRLQENYTKFVNVLPHEPLKEYVPGGFHPVALGDTFMDGRYTVRHKLGHGGYSTVWLARDNEDERVPISCLSTFLILKLKQLGNGFLSKSRSRENRQTNCKTTPTSRH